MTAEAALVTDEQVSIRSSCATASADRLRRELSRQDGSPLSGGQRRHQEGDTIVTSGVGGLFPAGLPVAKVTSVERDTASGFARAVCEPLAHPERYRHFLVLQVDVARAESNRQEVDSGGSD